MKTLLILPFIVCFFSQKKNTPSVSQPVERLENFKPFLNVELTDVVNNPLIVINDKQLLINDELFLINDEFKNEKRLKSGENRLDVAATNCQKTIQFDMMSVTTVRKNPKPIWQQRKEGITEITDVSTDNTEEFTEHSQLDICVSATGDCQWKVSNKRGKSPVYSPLSIYVVSCLRQMSGDYGALPEQIVSDMRAQGSSVQSIGNQTIVVKTPRHPKNGQFGMMIMDTSRCAFLGSSLYNSEDRLQFKVIYNYATNDQTGDRYLASATLITNDFERQTTTETTTFFNKK